MKTIESFKFQQCNLTQAIEKLGNEILKEPGNLSARQLYGWLVQLQTARGVFSSIHSIGTQCDNVVSPNEYQR